MVLEFPYRLSYAGYFLLNLPLKSFHGPDQELPGILSILQAWQQATCTRAPSKRPHVLG